MPDVRSASVPGRSLRHLRSTFRHDERAESFNVVNTLRLPGRWMRMFTIPNQSSVPMAYKKFDDEGRMRPSAYYDRVVDVMEELFKITLLLRARSDYLNDRYSERSERARKAIERQIEKL